MREQLAAAMTSKALAEKEVQRAMAQLTKLRQQRQQAEQQQAESGEVGVVVQRGGAGTRR